MRSDELKLVPGTGLSDLDLAFFEQEYVPRAISMGILNGDSLSLEERLAVTGMIESADEPVVTTLGLLVIGKDVRFHFPTYYIQFLRTNGVNWADDIIDEEVVRGNVSEQIRKLENKLLSHNRKIVKILSDTKKTYIYPPRALSQIVRNAILHRVYNYSEGSSPVYVRWFNDRILVTSPGGLSGDITPDNFGTLGRSSFRNPRLAEAMKVLGLVQGRGEGISIAKQAMEEAGNPVMEFIHEHGGLAVTLRPNKHAFQ